MARSIIRDVESLTEEPLSIEILNTEEFVGGNDQ